jgi:hypothetical protein
MKAMGTFEPSSSKDEVIEGVTLKHQNTTSRKSSSSPQPSSSFFSSSSSVGKRPHPNKEKSHMSNYQSENLKNELIKEYKVYFSNESTLQSFIKETQEVAGPSPSMTTLTLHLSALFAKTPRLLNMMKQLLMIVAVFLFYGLFVL